MGLFLPHQTDAAPGCGAINVASKGINSTTPILTKIKRSGPVGTVNQTVLVDPSTTIGCIFMQSENIGSNGASGIGQPGVVTWQAGNYVIRFNIITGNINVKIDSVFVHAVNGNGCGGLGLIASQTGIAGLTTAGVKTFTLNAASPSTVIENATVYITVALTNSSAMQQAIVILPNQAVDTPIMQPGFRTMRGVGM